MYQSLIEYLHEPSKKWDFCLQYAPGEGFPPQTAILQKAPMLLTPVEATHAPKNAPSLKSGKNHCEDQKRWMPFSHLSWVHSGFSGSLITKQAFKLPHWRKRGPTVYHLLIGYLLFFWKGLDGPTSPLLEELHEYLPMYSLHSYTNTDMNSMNSEFGFDDSRKINGNGERDIMDKWIGMEKNLGMAGTVFPYCMTSSLTGRFEKWYGKATKLSSTSSWQTQLIYNQVRG